VRKRQKEAPDLAGSLPCVRADRVAAFNPAASKEDAFFKDSRNIGLAAKKRAQKMAWTWAPALKKSLKN